MANEDNFAKDDSGPYSKSLFIILSILTFLLLIFATINAYILLIKKGKYRIFYMTTFYILTLITLTLRFL